MKWQLIKRLKFVLWSLRLINFKQVTSVGNRMIYVGWSGKSEVTITLRNTREPDGYARTELLEMLKLIRVEEERQHWKVPEPVACIYCHHISPINENGFCPVEVTLSDRKPLKCTCGTHQAGLNAGLIRDIGEALGLNKKKKKPIRMPCGQPLYEGIYKNKTHIPDAICTQTRGVEHSHHDYTALEAIEKHLAVRATCQSQMDGDCDWSGCPQEAENRKYYQSSCPLLVEDPER